MTDAAKPNISFISEKAKVVCPGSDTPVLSWDDWDYPCCFACGVSFAIGAEPKKLETFPPHILYAEPWVDTIEVTP